MARKIAIREGLFGIVCVFLAVTLSSPWWMPLSRRPPLLLVPMMDLTPCLFADAAATETQGQSDWQQSCKGPDSSAAHLVESTLHKRQPVVLQDSSLELGYTLQVPLLALMRGEQNTWRIDQQAIDTITRTVRDNSRSLVLYLFSTHFSAQTPIEPELARNPDNLAYTPIGPLSQDTYYTLPIYPWSVARTDNPITQYRGQVIQALLKSICARPVHARQRIKGITLLGEFHQLFPNFESGMGVSGAYLVSYYSPSSIKGFCQYLRSLYADIKTLDQQLSSDYTLFEEITPPSKDIHKVSPNRYQEHIDSLAAGQIPVTGWVHVSNTQNTKKAVNIYLNGQHIGNAQVYLSQQDVRAAHPEFNTANVGWRYNLNFSHLPIEIHRIDLALS